ncbi:MAG: hypothetical protein JNJ54_31495 [Myxococcaceae bacterium]|nr:hypothetical protein [Myxococcaceae bacterium]
MRPFLIAVVLCSGCSLRRGLDTDVCAAPHTLGASLAGVADGVLVYHFDSVDERLGTPCAGAPEPAACQAELARLAPTAQRHMRERGPGPLTLLLTRKGVVTRIDEASTWDDLSTFPPRARAQAWVELKRRLGVLCGGPNLAETPEGVRVLVSSHDGCFGGSDTLLLVRPDGAIEELRSRDYPQTCVG